MKKYRVPAIVIGLNGTALGIIRELGRRGVAVIGMDSLKGPAYWSRYCRPVLCPSIVDSPSGFLKNLMHQASMYDRPAVFPSNDVAVKFILDHYESLHRLVRLPFGDPAVIDSVLMKNTLLAKASNAGVQIPKTIPLHSEKDIDLADKELKYPFILKAGISTPFEKETGKKLLVMRSRRELADAFKRLSTAHILLAQELINGPDHEQFSCALYLNKDGKSIGTFAARKVRSYPTGCGVGTLVESIRLGSFCNVAVSFLQNLDYSGIAEVEFKRCPDSAQYKLIEVNTRSWAQNSLAEKCGVPLSFIAYQDTMGVSMVCPRDYLVGIKWLSFRRDRWAALDYLKKKQLSIRTYLASLVDVRVFSIYVSDDPLPGILLTFMDLLETFIRFLKKTKKLGFFLTFACGSLRRRGRNDSHGGNFICR